MLTVKPEFAGRSGDICTPLPARDLRPKRRRSPAAASLRRRAPARLRALSTTCAVPPAFENEGAPARPSRSQRWRMSMRTPATRSRCSQARSKGAASMAVGRTRPLEPTKVSCPGRRSSRATPAAKTLRWRRQMRRASPKRATKAANGSASVRLSPPRPASRNLRPADGIASYRSTSAPPCTSASAAIRPAGPPPMMATCCAGADMTEECSWIDGS